MVFDEIDDADQDAVDAAEEPEPTQEDYFTVIVTQSGVSETLPAIRTHRYEFAGWNIDYEAGAAIVTVSMRRRIVKK